ncbi:barstar family protein [Ornithinibacillus halotolerans]|uniref:Barstar (barnase inhibitor) domain-containing protein n=1 Tax=Ornithinibacillus halotolerans TaxID=1274357 RepID=A0A916WEP5_9BACI|nr:barstar family protein [Ornithinibacillus halotolerans]GGA91382.1 hypothetical protein GCM10008025_37370 [Ornithinibacillus halotolerans]
MTLVTLDGKTMQKKEDVHAYLKSKLNLPEYYGNNLDALWDVLSTLDDSMEIHFIHSKQMLECLGNYGTALLKVFEDAANENSNIKFRVIS